MQRNQIVTWRLYQQWRQQELLHSQQQFADLWCWFDCSKYERQTEELSSYIYNTSQWRCDRLFANTRETAVIWRLRFSSDADNVCLTNVCIIIIQWLRQQIPSTYKPRFDFPLSPTEVTRDIRKAYTQLLLSYSQKVWVYPTTCLSPRVPSV